VQRPLTAEGRAQAARIADVLAAEGIHAVLSSPSLRCRQTVQPLARKLGVELRVAERLAEGTRADDMLRYLAALREPVVAACTHGDVVEDLLRELAAAGVLADRHAPAKKASTWVLSLEGDAVLEARYVPPP